MMNIAGLRFALVIILVICTFALHAQPLKAPDDCPSSAEITLPTDDIRILFCVPNGTPTAYDYVSRSVSPGRLKTSGDPFNVNTYVESADHWELRVSIGIFKDPQLSWAAIQRGVYNNVKKDMREVIHLREWFNECDGTGGMEAIGIDDSNHKTFREVLNAQGSVAIIEVTARCNGACDDYKVGFHKLDRVIQVAHARVGCIARR